MKMDYQFNELVRAIAQGHVSEEDGNQLIGEYVALQIKMNKALKPMFDQNMGVNPSTLTSPFQEMKNAVKEAIAESQAPSEA